MGRKSGDVDFLIGTPRMPTIDKGILVLEDVNEHPFRWSVCFCNWSTPEF